MIISQNHFIFYFISFFLIGFDTPCNFLLWSMDLDSLGFGCGCGIQPDQHRTYRDMPWVIFYLVPNALSRQSPIIWVEKDHDLSNDDAVKYHQYSTNHNMRTSIFDHWIELVGKRLMSQVTAFSTPRCFWPWQNAEVSCWGQYRLVPKML